MRRQILAPLIILVLVLLLWEGLVLCAEIKPIILPAPHQIAAALVRQPLLFLRHLGITMTEAVLGFIAGSLSAFFLAAIFVHSSLARCAVYPYAIALKSTPLVAIAPLLVFWFGDGLPAKVLMAALVSFFPVLVNSLDGLLRVDTEAIDLMQSLAASRWQTFWKIRFPNALPGIFSALKIASALSVVGALIAEFTGSSAGIGHLINTSLYYLDTDIVFAGIFCVSLAGVGFFMLISWIHRRIVFWERQY